MFKAEGEGDDGGFIHLRGKGRGKLTSVETRNIHSSLSRGIVSLPSRIVEGERDTDSIPPKSGLELFHVRTVVDAGGELVFDLDENDLR